jgi:hypothetical protein
MAMYKMTKTMMFWAIGRVMMKRIIEIEANERRINAL